ncbi:MAG: NADH-quinone oxidoreductase subunit NuoE family protein [Candidatus Freyarchaeota archaeon]
MSMKVIYEKKPKVSLVKLIEDVIRKYDKSSENLILLLQEVQKRLGYLPRWSLELVSDHLRVALSKIYGVATFYHQFSLEPPGLYTIQLCMGTACHIKGNADNYKFLMNILNLNPDEKTTKDGLFTVTKVRCLGCCSLAPVMKVGDDIYGRVDFKSIRKIISKYRAKAKREKAVPPIPISK